MNQFPNHRLTVLVREGEYDDSWRFAFKTDPSWLRTYATMRALYRQGLMSRKESWRAIVEAYKECGMSNNDFVDALNRLNAGPIDNENN